MTLNGTCSTIGTCSTARYLGPWFGILGWEACWPSAPHVARPFFGGAAIFTCIKHGNTYHTCMYIYIYIYILYYIFTNWSYELRTKLFVWGNAITKCGGGPLSVIRVLDVRDINIKAEACNLHCGMMWFATWSRKYRPGFAWKVNCRRASQDARVPFDSKCK